jgi:hypothetical protein
VCVLPWALFVLVAGAAPTWRSLVGRGAFTDTFNPLYFIVRGSAWLLALGVGARRRAHARRSGAARPEALARRAVQLQKPTAWPSRRESLAAT